MNRYRVLRGRNDDSEDRLLRVRKENRMASKAAAAQLDSRFSSRDARPTDWNDAVDKLRTADTYWLTTVRPDGRPHVTPLVAVWHDDALFFCTGPDEQKAKNLAGNSNCILTTGCNTFKGFDLVVEGRAVPTTDDARLRRVAEAYSSKYQGPFRFEVADGAFVNGEGGKALVFQVVARKALAFRKDEVFSQTRWVLGETA
jgi:hypothetical protein